MAGNRNPNPLDLEKRFRRMAPRRSLDAHGTGVSVAHNDLHPDRPSNHSDARLADDSAGKLNLPILERAYHDVGGKNQKVKN